MNQTATSSWCLLSYQACRSAMHSLSIHFPGGAWDAGDRRWRLDRESQETFQRGEVSASSLLIKGMGKQKLANTSL